MLVAAPVEFAWIAEEFPDGLGYYVHYYEGGALREVDDDEPPEPAESCKRQRK